jgi:hypothetical protein
MFTDWPQSVARRVVLKAFLASDHVTAAAGLTVAVVISKNGAAFGNPAAGATNATGISLGWYYVDLAAADFDTLGDLEVRGTEATIDPAERVFTVSSPRLYRAGQAITTFTVGSASTISSVVTSALDPAASVTDQFKGLVLAFDKDTTTAALRGQKTDITGSSSGGVLTCTALTTAPVSGDSGTIE